jgi:hypothetical protein
VSLLLRSNYARARMSNDENGMRQAEYLVFVSHSARDTWVAKQIAKEVLECGATPFLDEADIEVGQDFDDAIRDFLNRAHELIVLLTPWALERPYVWSEIGGAWLRGLPIIPLLHGLTANELQIRPGVPVFLKSRDMIDLNDISLYFSQLRVRVQGGTRGV